MTAARSRSRFHTVISVGGTFWLGQSCLRHYLLPVAVASAIALLTPPASHAQESASDPELSAGELIRPALPAVERGLAFLASRQVDDGGFGTSGSGRNSAVCALGGLAFLAGASTPGRGPYGDEVARVTDFLLNHTLESGFIHVPEASLHGPMYGHGFATLFLAEVYGMSPRDDLREKLDRAVELIVRTQNGEGGWRYQPVRADADLSVTICQVMALRAARNAGIYVPNETIDLCIEYVKKSQNPDGGFRYMLQTPGSSFPRSAAGVVALYSAGIYEGREIEDGLAYVDTFLPRGNGRGRQSHFFYGHYYAVQAMWHAGNPRWQRWYSAIRDQLLAHQQPDGSWIDNIGREYATAMACIVLQMPRNAVPIFQR